MDILWVLLGTFVCVVVFAVVVGTATTFVAGGLGAILEWVSDGLGRVLSHTSLNLRNREDLAMIGGVIITVSGVAAVGVAIIYTIVTRCTHHL